MAGGRRPGAGRKLAEIDWAAFETMCAEQCTKVEIASKLGVDEKTLHTRAVAHYKDEFSRIYKRLSSAGLTSLRSTQFKLAQTNATLCIWLGKQYLGQRDLPIELTDEAAKKIAKQMKEDIVNPDSPVGKLLANADPK